MPGKRQIFSGKFKAEVALEAFRGDKSINELADEFDIHPNQIGRWKKELLDGVHELFEKTRGRKKTSDKKQLDKLYKQLTRLKATIDKLKITL